MTSATGRSPASSGRQCWLKVGAVLRRQGGMAALRLLLGCLLAMGAGFILLLSVTFGSGGFGAGLPNAYEALSQSLLVLAMLAPASLMWWRGSTGWAVFALQVVLIFLGMRLGN